MKKYSFLTLLLATQGCIADLSVPVPQPSDDCTPPEGREVLLEVFPTCDLGMCGDLPEHQARGRCVDDNQLEPAQLEQLAACANAKTPQHCVPVGLLLADGQVQPPVCTSVAGAEGRCMSLCIPQIQAKKDTLPQDVCDEGMLCAPCYDPFTGESSGACESNSCDMPTEDPVVFAACCVDKGGGSCVPRELVPDESEGNLGEDSCTGTPEDDVCVPTGMAEPDFQPKACESGWVSSGEGLCLSECIPLIGGLAGTLFDKKAPCTATERCVACSDLTKSLSPTIAKFCDLVYPPAP